MTEQQSPGNSTENAAPSRQTIRKWILIISFVLLPVTLFYISPIIILMGAAEGVATGSMLLFIANFILSLVVARLWCGWLCPMGAWQEICTPVMKHTVQDGWRNYVKYLITAAWLVLLGYLFMGAGGIRAIDPFYATDHGLSITSVEPLIVVIVIFLIIFAAAFFMGRRGFCRVLCPIAPLMIIGRKIRNLAGWPALGLTADKAKCIDCNKCSNECPMGLDVHGMVKDEKMETPECIDCATCADVCPKGAITFGIKGR
ncbi:MAG: 4Fe-4S binding protein [Methanomicrobiales archaeon]|nr:4Fe-4S binding protein [Methanomicrobiales archaeon]